jgi:hypothetical protein
MRSRRAGVTLLEMTIAITLLSLLTLGTAIAMRVGFDAFAKTDKKLMDIRRVAGAQHLLHQELAGLIPVLVACGDNSIASGFKAAFFQGEPSSMRLVSSFSLQQGWRGAPQILEMTVTAAEQGQGVRLVVNEVPYTGYLGTARFCTSATMDPSGAYIPHFIPVSAGEHAFVLADQLAYCRLSYYGPGKQPEQPPAWSSQWTSKGWPWGIRVEMAPFEPDPSRIQPITVTAPIHIRRDPGKNYEDLH